MFIKSLKTFFVQNYKTGQQQSKIKQKNSRIIFSVNMLFLNPSDKESSDIQNTDHLVIIIQKCCLINLCILIYIFFLTFFPRGEHPF